MEDKATQISEDHQSQPDYSLVPDDTPFRDGFNSRTIWAALFAGLVMTPGAIYLSMVTGQSVSGAAEWVTIIMFIEIGKRLFVKLTPQETIILYWLAGGMAVATGPIATMIWNQYLIQAPQSDGLAQYIPRWVVPPRGSEALVNRTFFHSDWAKPVMLTVLTSMLGMVNALSMGYVVFRVTNDVERLPFPMAPVYAGGATALAESSTGTETWRWRVFTIGSVIGMAWGLIFVVIPTVSNILTTQKVEVIPIPFADFTTRVKSIIPASPIGLGTDLGGVLIGFVLPFWVVVGTFTGSMLVTFFVNPFLYRTGILYSWDPGMNTIPAAISNSIDFWLSFSIGTALVIGVIGVVSAARSMIQAGKRRSSERSPLNRPAPDRGDIRLTIPLLVWGISTMCYVILVRILIPDFPWWIVALFGFLWTPFFSYIGARMIGLTGAPYGTSFPYVKEGSFYLSGYKGAAIWFAPIPMFEHGQYASAFKQLELTRTRFSSFVKLSVLGMVVTFVFGMLFWSLIWKLAPVPSAAYPYIDKMWPLQATMQTIWVRSTLPGEGGEVLKHIIKWKYIGAGSLVAGLTYGLVLLVKAPTLLFYGFIGGLGTWPHYALPTFIGALLGRYYFAKRFGVERWAAYTPVVLAGYGCGLGLVGMTSVALALIAKATEQIVF